jgi:hypothetical protein
MKINEKLGVPEGLNKQAANIHKSLIKYLETFDDGYPIDLKKFKDDKFVYLVGKYDIKISDLEFKKIPLKLILHYKEHPKNPILFSASYGSTISFGDDPKSFSYDMENSHFSINVSVDSKTLKSQIVDVIFKNLHPSLISHELMHFYDKYKSGNEKVKKRVEYVSYQIGGFPKILNEFLFLLYYMTGIENVVRPSELQHIISDNSITKSEFKDFVYSTDIMKNVKRAEKFSLKEFKQNLDNDDDVIKMVNHGINNGYKSIGSISDDALNILMINLIPSALNTSSELLKQYVNQFASKMNPFEIFIARYNNQSEMSKRSEKATKEYGEILKKYNNYLKNPEKYFEYLEKMLNFTGNKLKRKLFKLFDMAKEDKKDNSILNWEVHNKINAKSESLNYTLDFESFKSKFK